VRTSLGSRRVAGFTLIEVLVALVVLSIGLLGIAALYVETLRANRSALVRTQAIALASDLADRIRANRNPADAYITRADGSRADLDLDQWEADIGDRLPGGSAGILRFRAGTATTPAQYMIIISWPEVGQDNPSTYELRLEI
jgi:type IV pilus assembly protein PilV